MAENVGPGRGPGGRTTMFQKVKQTFNEKPKFSVITLAVFAVVFVLIGSYFIYQSLASQEAEIAADKETKKIETMTEHLKADSAAYKSTMPSESKPKLEDIKKTAQERKQEMKRLATADPDTFLVNAIRKEEKAALVDDVKAYVEDQVTVTGVYSDKLVDGSNKMKPKVSYSVKAKDKTYNLNFNQSSSYGLFIDPNTTTEFYGYSIDNDLVIPNVANVGYKENTKLNSPKDPKGKVKFEGTTTQDVAGGITTGTGTVANELPGIVIPGVPGYKWRDGCGPTGTGMVIGYYDGNGYGNLVPGDATNDNTDTQQMIASHGTSTEPKHYEDYSLPMDTNGLALDKSELPVGDEHASDSAADFMKTSWSIQGSYYGWSWASNMGPSFIGYVRYKYPEMMPSSKTYGGPSLTWEMYKAEIDAKRPVGFLVDTSGDGGTDHFVTGVGYREVNGYPEYAVWDTWSTTTLRWAQFRPMSNTYAWGVWGAAFYYMEGGQLPVINSFTATPSTISTGSYSQLAWSVSNMVRPADQNGSITISKGTELIGTYPHDWDVRVYPTETSTYTLTATNDYGTLTKNVTVTVTTVTPPPPPPPTDTTAPAVSLSGMENGVVYKTGRYTIVGNATDASGIAKIEIIVSGKVMATCSNVTTCSYILNIKKLAVGTHTVTVKAYDKASPANVGTNQIMIARVK